MELDSDAVCLMGCPIAMNPGNLGYPTTFQADYQEVRVVGQTSWQDPRQNPRPAGQAGLHQKPAEFPEDLRRNLTDSAPCSDFNKLANSNEKVFGISPTSSSLKIPPMEFSKTLNNVLGNLTIIGPDSAISVRLNVQY